MTEGPGSWYPLLDAVREAVELARAERANPLPACPNDGEPLKTGPDGQLFCPFDGWGPGDKYVSDRVSRWGR